MKQKFREFETVYIIESGAAHTNISKCIVVACHPIKLSDDPKSPVVDYHYDLNYAYSSKKEDSIKNTLCLYSVPQSNIFKTYKDCKKFVIKNFDTFFLKI